MKKSGFLKDTALPTLQIIEISWGLVSEKDQILIYGSLTPYENTVNPCC